MKAVSTPKRLDEIYQHAQVLPFDSDSKLILMSDCHRGQGNAGDNFLANQTVCFGALQYYYQKGFTYIELGDGDELWENRQLKTLSRYTATSFGYSLNLTSQAGSIYCMAITTL